MLSIDKHSDLSCLWLVRRWRYMAGSCRLSESICLRRQRRRQICFQKIPRLGKFTRWHIQQFQKYCPEALYIPRRWTFSFRFSARLLYSSATGEMCASQSWASCSFGCKNRLSI